MPDRRCDDATRALHALHDRLWDPAAELVRVAPGVTPGVDAAAWNLHAVRESTLGALVDLRHGHATRAAAAIRRVVGLQYRDDGVPWSGTFKVCAEEHDPPADGAQQWFHYDPNWRQ